MFIKDQEEGQDWRKEYRVGLSIKFALDAWRMAGKRQEFDYKWFALVWVGLEADEAYIAQDQWMVGR